MCVSPSLTTIRGQPAMSWFSPSTMESWGWNSGLQVWWWCVYLMSRLASSPYSLWLCVCHVWVTCMCGGQRTFRNQFSPSTWTLGIELKLSGLYGKCFYLLFPPCLNQPFYSTTLPQIIALQAFLTYKWQISHRSGQAAISGSLSLPFLFLPELNSMWWPEAQHLSCERETEVSILLPSLESHLLP